jgi:hypothetical protein
MEDTKTIAYTHDEATSAALLYLPVERFYSWVAGPTDPTIAVRVAAPLSILADAPFHSRGHGRWSAARTSSSPRRHFFVS